MIKLIKTIKQERGELTVSVFRTDGQITYDAVFVPDKKKGEMFRTEIHGVSPQINHEVIIAVDDFLKIEEDLKNSGISEHELTITASYQGECILSDRTRIHALYAKKILVGGSHEYDK